MAPRASGTHRFMFAHGGILWQATDYDSVEAETFVFRPGAGLVAVPVLSRRADQPRAREDRPVRYGERDKCGAPQRRPRPLPCACRCDDPRGLGSETREGRHRDQVKYLA